MKTNNPDWKYFMFAFGSSFILCGFEAIIIGLIRSLDNARYFGFGILYSGVCMLAGMGLIGLYARYNAKKISDADTCGWIALPNGPIIVTPDKPKDICALYHNKNCEAETCEFEIECEKPDVVSIKRKYDNFFELSYLSCGETMLKINKKGCKAVSNVCQIICRDCKE